jgi:hypothetical protein
LLGELSETTRLVGIFLVGSSFYLFRDRIPYAGWAAAASLVALFFALFIPFLAEFAITTIGAYAMFWFALRAAPLGKFLTHDISYGLYLYAWPISSLLYYHGVTFDPWYNAALTLVFGSCAGLASWLLVERPSLLLKRAGRRV